MSIKLTLESPVGTLEQFEEILNSYKTQNTIYGVCSPMDYEPEGIVENVRDYLKFERNIGISRILFHWENIFTGHKLEYTDFCNTIDMVSCFLISRVLFMDYSKKTRISYWNTLFIRNISQDSL